MATEQQYTSLRDENPWEDSDWLPSDAEFLLPKDRLEQMLLEVPAQEVTSTVFATVAPDDRMDLALFRMRQHGLRAVLVMDGEALIGIVTERDAVQHVEPGTTGADCVVRDLMTPDPVLVGVDEPVGAAVQRMAVEGVHHLPVIDEMQAKVVGVLTQSPLLHRIIETILNEEWASE